jgi:ubiquinone/menaquinone biosynthesis C-methylase UbiE
MIQALKKLLRKSPVNQIEQLNPVSAYDIWADNYDNQPGNLMLDLDEQVFSGLLNKVDIENKRVADIGCGTGRHWDKLLKGKPLSLTGFDVSAGMLKHLEEKYPQADTYRIIDNQFSFIPDDTYDVIISTLTVAHIDNIKEALNAWARIASEQADIIITDFHPIALAAGGQRTFEHNKSQIAVENHVHYVFEIEEILLREGFNTVNLDERVVNENVKSYYTAKNALHVYEKFQGSKIIYGIHLKRG